MNVTLSMPRAGEISGKWCSEKCLTSLTGTGEGDSSEIWGGSLHLPDDQQKSVDSHPSPTAGLKKKSEHLHQGEK